MKSTGENTIFMNQSNFRTCRVYTAGPTCGGMGLRTLPKAPVRRQRHLPRCCSSRCQVQRGHGNNRMSPQRPFQHHGILGERHCINNQPFPLAPAERACQRQMDCCLLRTEQEKVTENIDGTAKLLWNKKIFNYAVWPRIITFRKMHSKTRPTKLVYFKGKESWKDPGTPKKLHFGGRARWSTVTRNAKRQWAHATRTATHSSGLYISFKYKGQKYSRPWKSLETITPIRFFK